MYKDDVTKGGGAVGTTSTRGVWKKPEGRAAGKAIQVNGHQLRLGVPNCLVRVLSSGRRARRGSGGWTQ